MNPPNTIVRCGNYTYAATHPDGLCEACRKPWTVAVYCEATGRWLCWGCSEAAPPPTAGCPPERGAGAG
jgi:hypothetical protein